MAHEGETGSSRAGRAPFGDAGEPGESRTASLEARLARFEALVGALPDLVFRLTKDLVFLDFMAPADLPTYRPPEDFLGRPMDEVMPESLVALARPAVARALATGEVQTFENVLDYPDGLRTFETRMVRSGVDEVIAIVRDISAQARADAAERRAVEGLRVLNEIGRAAVSSLELPVLCRTLSDVLFETLHLGGASIALFEEPGRMRVIALHRSGEGEHTLGRPVLPVPEYVRAAVEWDATLREYTIPEGAEDLVSVWLRAAGIRHALTIPLRVERATPAVLNLGWSADPKLDDDQRALLRAIGDRIAPAVANALLLERVRQHERELRQAQRLEALGRLAGGIAHDFNNLLTIVEMHLGLARRRLARGASAGDDLDVIEETARRAAAMTRKLLAFGRRGPLDLEVVDIDEVLTGIEGIVQRLLGESVQLATRHGAAGAFVEADRTSIEQVLLNLALNAREAMPHGGTLRIESELLDLDGEHGLEPGPHVHLIVSDTGVGMDEATLERIFDPFFTTKAATGGSGLGLATVHGVVTQSRGRVTVDSAPGAGTTFHLYLPRVSPPLPSEAPARAASSPAEAFGTILLVEDDADVRTATARLLRDRGYDVWEACDGVDALELMGRSGDEVGVVVTDVVMPRMGGVELVRRLAAERPTLPVLILSGYDEGRLEGLPDHPSVVAALLKPVSPERLLSVLDTALRARHAQR